jgi:type I restriction enzyme S subunit
MTDTSVPWPLVRLDEVATIDRDSVSAQAIKAGTKYVGLEHLDSEGGFVGVPEVSPGDLASNKFVFHDKHILFGKLRPYLRKTARPSFTGVCSTDIVPVLPGARVDRGFLYHFLRHPETVEKATLRCAGANLPRLSPRDLAAMELPLPSLPEQRRIAAILDKADSIRHQRKEAIALTEELLRSAFLEMFGDPVTNPKGWEVKSLGELIDQERGISYGVVQRGPEIDGGVPVVRISNFGGNRFDGAEVVHTSQKISDGFRRTILRGGELVVSIRGTVGRVAIVPNTARGWNVSREVAVIPLLPNASGSFVQRALLTESLQRFMLGNVKGVAQSGINLLDLRLAPIPKPDPSSIARWESFTRTVEGAERRLRDASEAGSTLFDSLVHRAFRGELRERNETGRRAALLEGGV